MATKATKAKRNPKKAPDLSVTSNLEDIGKLAQRAILVDTDLHYWHGHKRDEKLTKEINGKYQSKGAYNKQLINLADLRPVHSAYILVDKIHRKYSCRWSDDGWRIISSAAIPKWDKEMRDAIALAMKEADKFAAIYTGLVDDMKREDKSFDASHYPTQQEIRNKFRIVRRYKPVPQGNDIRISLSDDALAAIRASVDEDQQSRIQTTIEDIVQRIKKTVGHMIESLRDYVPPTKNRKAENTFKDTLVSNVRDLADLLPALNVTGSKIDAVAAELAKLVETITPNQLRDEEKTRLATAKAADEILKKVDAFI